MTKHYGKLGVDYCTLHHLKQPRCMLCGDYMPRDTLQRYQLCRFLRKGVPAKAENNTYSRMPVIVLER